MTALGLRARLAFAIGAIVLLALGATFVAVYRGTGARLRTQVQDDLAAQADSLSAQLEPSVGSPRRLIDAARSSIGALPTFAASSRLVVVSVPGEGIATNEPELLGLVGGRPPEESTPDRRAERGEAGGILGAPSGLSTIELEDAGDVLLLSRPLTGSAATVITAEPLVSVDRAQDGVSKTFLIAGSLTLVAALIAAAVTASRTAAPLRRMAATAGDVDHGDLAHRMPEAGPQEVRALAESFNRMLDRLESAFGRQRSFVADASHELRTPLTAIRGQIEVLARAHPGDEEIQSASAHVNREIARMDRLVGDLLLLTQSDEGTAQRREAVDLRALVSETASAVGLGSGRSVEVSSFPGGEVPGDGDRLAQVVGNLVRNALEHTEAGGTVRVSGAAGAGRVRIDVDDDGPGIPAAQRALVFDRFHRVDGSRVRSTGGSGLGLAIARAIIEAHGGTIWVEGSPLGGARVSFELPGFEPA